MVGAGGSAGPAMLFYRLSASPMSYTSAQMPSAKTTMPTKASRISHSLERHSALSKLTGFSGGGGSRRMRDGRGAVLILPVPNALLTHAI